MTEPHTTMDPLDVPHSTGVKVGSGVWAAHEAGVTYRQIDFWCRTGVLTPSIQPASGSGSQRVYSAADVEALQVLGLLRRVGEWNRGALQAIAAHVQQHGQVGTVDVIPGVQVDVDRLVAEVFA